MKDKAIRLFISGDFAPTLRVNEIIQKGEFQSLYNNMLPVIQEADYAITNLELPLLDKGIPSVKTGPNLKAPTNSIDAIKFAGFNLVTLANNHIMDYGADGLLSTIDLCSKNSIEYIGVGATLKEAKEIRYKNIKGKRIAFINIAENEWSTTFKDSYGVNPLDEIDVFYQISEAKLNSDFIILIIHGGHETYELPSPRMKKLYRFFIDLGVDVVVGHHTHCYSGHEVYKDKPIFYSLGNFIFDNKMFRNNSFWNKGCAVTISLFEAKIEFQLHPFSQCDDKPGVFLFDEENYKRFVDENIIKTDIILNDKQLVKEYDSFVAKQTKVYKSLIEPFHNRYILGAMNKGFLPRLISGYQKDLLFNIIRCESHRELLLSVLSKK